MTNFISVGCLRPSSFHCCLASFRNYYLAFWFVLVFWCNSHIVELTNWPSKYFWQISIYFKDNINYCYESGWEVFERTMESQQWKFRGFSIFKQKKNLKSCVWKNNCMKCPAFSAGKGYRREAVLCDFYKSNFPVLVNYFVICHWHCLAVKNRFSKNELCS